VALNLLTDPVDSSTIAQTLLFRRHYLPSRGDNLVKLGRTWFRVFPFETRRCGEALSCPPRSVGVACLAQDGCNLATLGQEEALAVCRRYLQEPDPAQSAKEKVVFANRQGEMVVFQGDRKNGSAALCSCGNATCAGAAMLASAKNQERVRQICTIPDGELDIRSAVTLAGAGGWRVAQSWCGLSFPVAQENLCGHEVAIGTGTFNNYVMLVLPGREPDSFDVPEVLELWKTARPFGFDNILRSRLAAIFPTEPHPFVKFYTCGRAHPGAPLTGLAALAMAARQVDWLASALQRGRIQHRRGFDSLPVCHDSQVDFPALHVVLKEQQQGRLAA